MSLRFAFNCGRWHPTKEQFLSALTMIQNEERKRVCDFVFQRDVKTALIGRLLIRRAIRTCLNLRNDKITLGRTEHGRPFLICDDPKIKDSNFDFNISHQDDLVVLACETSRRVGVDTMCMERPVGSSSTERFFDLMRRQLSDNEWSWLHCNGKTEQDRLVNFYRIWCMKESYVKAIGVGIGFSLSRLDCCMVDDVQPKATLNESPCLEKPFNHVKIEGAAGQGVRPDTGQGQQGEDSTPAVLRSSFLRVDSRNMKDWLFEETILMGKYLVCVAVESNPSLGEMEEHPSLSTPAFQFPTIEELLEGSSESSGNEDEDGALEEFSNEWDLYLKKEQKPSKNK